MDRTRVCVCVFVTPAVCVCLWSPGEEERGLGDGARRRQRQRVLLRPEEDAHPACGGGMSRPPARRRDHAPGERTRRIRLPAETRAAAGHSTDR